MIVQMNNFSKRFPRKIPKFKEENFTGKSYEKSGTFVSGEKTSYIPTPVFFNLLCKAQSSDLEKILAKCFV
jgi:hypothetical protein